MKCKDCSKFKPSSRIEAGAEISPDARSLKGRCEASKKNCQAEDSCGCGSFSKK